jgi:cation/acetate symporter
MYESSLYATYSLLLALCFGTMGLPHVLVRFYTNPDGRAARQTTVVVLGLLGRLLPVPTPVRRPGPELRARLEALDLREICLLTTL